MIHSIFLFISGVLFANSLPHFINGIGATTRDYHNPKLYHWFQKVPSPVFNVIYGVLNFVIGVLILPDKQNLIIGLNHESYMISAGFVFSALGLSALFHKRRTKE